MHLLVTNIISYILENRLGIVSLVPSTMRVAARIYSALKHSGELIEDDDILIAALAFEHDAVLVTNNVRHFSRLEGLKILSLLD